MNTITITLNPAYDIYCRISSFELHRENLIREVFRSAGGKSINITRALVKNGLPSEAIMLLGRNNCEFYENALKEENIVYHPFYTDASIRENFTVIPDNDSETRICFDNFTADKSVLDDVIKKIREMANKNDILTFSGKFPKGICKEDALDFLRNLKEISTKLVVDTNSLTGSETVSVSPWLIKPNEQEIEAFMGRRINDKEEIIEEAQKIHRMGVENVLITLGGEGAVYAGSEGVYVASAPKITVLSTVGSGDSSIAGFIAATVDGKPIEERIRTAIAFGSAACLREGTAPPLGEDILRLKGEITVRKVI